MDLKEAKQILNDNGYLLEDIDDVINANARRGGGRYWKVQRDYNHYKNYTNYDGKPELFDDTQRNRQVCAAIYLKNKFGVVPLHIACAYGNEEIISRLIKKGANIYYKTKYSLSKCLKQMDIYHNQQLI